MADKTKTKAKPKRKAGAEKSKTGTSKRKVKVKVKRKEKKARQYFLIFTVCLLIITSAVFGAFSSKRGSTEFANINKSIAYGIDVSYHNGKIDWETVKGEVDFAFIRVGFRGYTDGKLHTDSKAKYNLKNANKSKIPIGVYFYSQAINEQEARQEAEYLIERIRGYDISLPVVIDFEYPFKNGSPTGRLADADLSRKERTDLINAFCEKVESEGYIPAVYASSSVFRNQIYVKKLNKNAMIWVADYNKNVTYGGNYDFWQFSEKGECKGVPSKYVDTNYWYIEKNADSN